MTLSKYLQFFFNDLIKNKSKILRVFYTIFISLFIFSTVIILKSSIENEIESNSRVLLGGDQEISTKNKSLNEDSLASLRKSFFVTEIIEFTSILRIKNKKSKTTRIKIIDEFYPLIGKENVEPVDALNTLKNTSETILIDETIKNYLGIELGDRVRIQNTSFEVIGTIKSLPDIGGMFAFGDNALINRSSLENLEINNLGSFINYKYKIIAKNESKEIPNKIKENNNLIIKYPSDISENLTKTIENFIYFLSIISVSSLLISGIGLKNSLFSFFSTNQTKIAIYKSLGLSSNQIKILYYSQILLILIFSSLTAYIFALFLISFIDTSLLNILKINLNPAFEINEYLVVQGFSLMIFFIFAKPVLTVIEKIRVVDLFRNSNTHLNLTYSRRSIIEISIFILLFFFCFCLYNVKPYETGLFFFFFSGIGFFYYLISKAHIVVLNKMKKIKNLPFKLAIKNLHTYSNLNSIVIITMGLGITILLFLGMISFNINKELNGSIPKNAPNFFFVGIQKDELNLFSEQINEMDTNVKQRIVPMISARIEAINNKKPKEIINKQNKSYWFINGERRISWSKNPPTNNQVVKGKWWYSDQKNNLEISLDQKVANDFNLEIGDSITFNIYGNNVSGTITNLRKVDYRDLNINFAILFNPKYASTIPHEFLSSIQFKNEESVNLNKLLNELPNITYIKLSEYLDKTKSFLNKLFIVSILISSIVILIGFLVISNAINVIGMLKVHQNLVLRVLGFEKSNIVKLIIFESIILFIPIIFFSLIFSNISSYFFIKYFFGIDWHFSFLVFLLISSLLLTTLTLTFLVSNRKYLNFNLYFLLRNE